MIRQVVWIRWRPISALLGGLATLLLQSPVPVQAQGLSAVVITAVRSEKRPAWEPIAPLAISTKAGHGGAWVEVITEESGYASAWEAKLGIQSGTLISTVSITQGSRVVGFRRTWRMRNTTPPQFGPGIFRIWARSASYPYSARDDIINIR